MGRTDEIMESGNSIGIRAIIRILWKNTAVKLPGKRIYKVLATVVLAGILIPCAVVVGFMSYVMTQALILAGNPGAGMLFEMQLLSAFSMVFGILVIFSVLFFSSDREHFVTLPIPAHQLMMAKFLYAYIAESVMECFVLSAVFVGYLMAAGEEIGWSYAVHPVSVAGAVLGTLLLPLVPMVYCAIFSLVLITSLRKVRSEGVFYRISGLLLAAFAGLFLYSLRGIGGINIENYVEALGSGKDLFLRTLNGIFFPVPWLANAIEKGSMKYLVWYLAANALLVAAMYLLGRALYQEGLYTAAALGSVKKAGIRKGDLRKASVFGACVRKEMRVLTRTRAFANNCVYVNLIWPAGALGLLHFARKQGSVAEFIFLYRMGKERAELTVTLGVIFVTLIATAMNSVASTAFTREGRHISLLKYIPVPYDTQILAKALVSTLITFPALLAALLILCSGLEVSIMEGLFYAALMFPAHVIGVSAGMWLDSMSPYTTWDDEYSALRGNINTFFNMGVMLIIAAAVLGLSVLLYEILDIPLRVYELVLLVVLAGLAVGAALIGSEEIRQNMGKF